LRRRALIAAAVLVVVILWSARTVVVRFFPIHHTGVVVRVGQFSKGGMRRQSAGTHQIRQFAVLFEDGFHCEASDTAFAAVREGDLVHLRAYHDVKGWPILDPEWWECDEGQLVSIDQPAP